MAEVSETCSCGAQLKWNGNDSSEAVLKVFESWRTSHRHSKDEPKKPDPVPGGNNFSSTERKYDNTPHELDTERRPGPYGRGISLKWHPAS